MELFFIFVSTKVFSITTFIILMGLIIGVVYRHRGRRAVIQIAIATVMLSVVVQGLKEFFAVARPENAKIFLDSYAFPSAHAAGVMFLAVMAWFCLHILYRFSNAAVIPVLLVITIAVGGSRLYLGVHTIEQVLVGYLVGLIVAMGALYFMKR